MLGTLPFSGFVLFISWRIAISAQQVAACEGGSVEMCEAAAKRKLKRGETDLAVELFGRGCALGSVECCFEAAALDRQAGRSAEALPRIAAACDAGHLLACETLGTMLKNGEGTLADPAGAAAPLERACDGGRANACETLRLLMQAPTR